MNAAVDRRLLVLDAMLESERPLSALETLCIQRQINDLKRDGSDGLVWNEDEASRAVEVARLHRHWQGKMSGKRFEPEPWQDHCLLAPMFGWYREVEMELRRRFTVGYVEIPRKNGKSFGAAVVGNQGLVADGEQGPEVYAAATTRDQAAIVFKDAQNTARQSPELMRHLRMQRHAILCPSNNGVFSAVSADYNFLQGKKPSRVIIDELHAHKTRDVWDALLTGMGARRNPLLFAITTAGFDRSSICWEQHEASRKILEGIDVEDSFFCYIACAEPEDDICDPHTWWKANPNLGVSLEREFLETESRKASRSPQYENTFRRLHLNQWTEQAVRWLPMHEWDACDKRPIADAELIGRTCYGGLDLGQTRDTTSMVLVFPMDDGSFVLRPTIWIPRDAKDDRTEQDRRQLRSYAADGWIRETDGNISDYDGQIPDDIIDETRQFDVQSIAYDPWHAEAVRQKLINRGMAEDVMVEFRQTIGNFAGPTKEFERLVLSHKIRHGGNPVLRWMASNVAVKFDTSNNMKPVKPDPSSKIDAIVAAIMGVGLATQSLAGASVYEREHRGFLEIG